jgi:hypothetical protein
MVDPLVMCMGEPYNTHDAPASAGEACADLSPQAVNKTIPPALQRVILL